MSIVRIKIDLCSCVCDISLRLLYEAFSWCSLGSVWILLIFCCFFFHFNLLTNVAINSRAFQNQTNEVDCPVPFNALVKSKMFVLVNLFSKYGTFLTANTEIRIWIWIQQFYNICNELCVCFSWSLKRNNIQIINVSSTSL